MVPRRCREESSFFDCKADSRLVGATIIPAAVVLACLTLIGCKDSDGDGGGGGDSGKLSWSACVVREENEYLGPGLPCVMQAKSIPKYTALRLGSRVVGRVDNTSQHAAGIQVTMDCATKDNFSAVVDSEGKLHFGTESVRGGGFVVEIWHEDGILSGISLDSSSRLSAPVLNGVSSINMEEDTLFSVSRLSGDKVKIFTGSNSVLQAKDGTFKSVEIHEMYSSKVDLGSLTTDTASLVVPDSSSFKGMITTNALKVNISGSAKVETSVSSDVEVRGSCADSSVLQVKGGSTKGVVGVCTGWDSYHAFLKHVV
eukprot:TRINITY_DN7425_c0_g1_i2.p1 TRINITY_DN7425_c0_g1~~TRINITY_DN7425_c0_g1_i2.p1  ORF type:complete len:313 (+),score=36.47 TRINITY_DN7425_c0_g1_i2:97-1035(+)